ncbi:MAG: mechanosensitive ion channel family protein [Phycisphaerales bacterium JB063]
MLWDTFKHETQAWAILLAVILCAAFATWWAMTGVGALIRKHIEGATGRWLRRPVTLALPAAAALLCAPAIGLHETTTLWVRHTAGIVLMAGVGWLLVAFTGLLGDVITHHYPTHVRDNRRARSIHTRFRVLRRVWIVLITICTLGAICFTFPSIRSLGAGLLASAGVAGIVIGIAARPFVETLLASLQIALTEPIRLDDVVIVEGEWGRVEEIRATYVAVRIWDDRRLVVPLTYFIQQPFQNWTRTTADITGAVTLKVDYRTPVEQVREQAGQIVAGCEYWDQRFWNLAVTDCDDKTMTLRVLATAADASAAWELRCCIREALIDYLQREHPDALPRHRASLDTADPFPADPATPEPSEQSDADEG